MKSEKKQTTVQKTVLAAMFAALTCVATMVIKIPIPATNGYINIGDCIVLMSGWLLGGVYGTAAAGIGSAFADMLLGYMTYAPGTFVIKALMALVTYTVHKAIDEKYNFTARLVSSILAEAVMVFGYFVYEATILGYGIGALGSVLSNIIQGVGGVVIAVLVMELIKNNRFVQHFFERF